MNILDIIKTRRSVREFKDQEIPESAIDVLIEAVLAQRELDFQPI